MVRRWFLLGVLVALACAAVSPAGPASADEPTSLVDWLKALGQDASFRARASLFAERYPGEAYGGSLEQNVRLFETLREERAAGRFPPGGLPPPQRRAPSTPPRDVAPPPVPEPAPVPEPVPAPAPVPDPEPPPRRPAPSATPAVPLRTVDDPSGWQIVLDPRDQSIAIDLLHRRVRGGDDGERETPIAPTLPVTGGFVSAAMLLQKAKVFDDGLYAAVELAAQEGAGRFRGKRALLEDLRARLADVGPEALGPGTATPFLAARAAGVAVPVPPPLVGLVEAQLRAFDENPVASKPIAFYTWSAALRSIFRQDRIVQPALPPGGHRDALARAIHASPASRATYEGYLALVERLTNPFVGPDLRASLAALDRGDPLPGGPAAFLPASRSRETDLLRRLEAAGVDTAALSAMDAFVRSVRDGSLSLAVRPDSGWYDRQQWSLEPLLRPEVSVESRRVTWSEPYRARAAQLFRGVLALTRETHVKALDVPLTSAAPPPRAPTAWLRPDLSVEPHPTVYLRRADTYRFVRGLLERVFGAEGLEAMRRLTPDGPMTSPLSVELAAMETLLLGAYARACFETGTPAGSLPGLDVAETAFGAWAQSLSTDPDLAQDVRMMVPVSYDPARGIRVWCVLGWATDELALHYARPPEATLRRTTAPQGAPEPLVSFAPQTANAAYPVFVETWTKQLLDRVEFRRLCDAHKTREAILAALAR